jgi:glutamate---cysteine ligase / carboxylate-amine ligase
MLAHRFDGTPFSIGVEEELMLIDAETHDLAHEIEAVLAGIPERLSGQVKPELFQSVLEVATTPCANVGEAADELVDLRRSVSEVAGERGCMIGAAGTHPFALPENQKVVDRDRYRHLVEQLGYIARQEIIFGTHVHVGINGPDKAIYVADGIRRYLPLLLGLSANSPFWCGQRTGMMSTRTPVFRAFPRVGIPPHYGSWEIYSRRVELMMEAGAIEDYTYLWWDVRPHPNLGTVETRVFDQQTRLEHTMALTAMTVSLAHRLSTLYEDGEVLVEVPTELVDDNKVRAACRGMEGELVDFPHRKVVPAVDMVRHLMELLREDAEELGCLAELEGVDELISRGTGARRQLEMVDGGVDLRALVAEIADKSRV